MEYIKYSSFAGSITILLTPCGRAKWECAASDLPSIFQIKLRKMGLGHQKNKLTIIL